MSALGELRAVYRSRFEPRYAETIGYVGADVPREVIEAAGVIALRLAPIEGIETTFADRVLGPGVDSSIRGILAALLEGAYPVDRLVLCSESDHTVRLYTTLRRLTGHGLDLWFVDLLHLPRASTDAYDREQLNRLVDWIGGASDLAGAIAATNRLRELGDRLSSLRRGGVVSSRDALAILGAGTALPAGRYAELLEGALGEVERGDGTGDGTGRTVVMLGSDHSDDAVYAAADELGATVVGETHGWGEALLAGRVGENGDPVARLVSHYRVRPRVGPAPAEVTLAWIQSGDEGYAWSLPQARRELGRDLTVVRSLNELRKALT